MTEAMAGRTENKTLTTASLQPSNSSADDRSVAGLIARLLLHFWTPQDLSDGARKAMAEDWLTDLREFGPDIVAEACSTWRRTETKRPAIADIRSLCIREQQERRPVLPALPASTAAARDEYARSMGFASWAAREAAIAEQELRYRKAEVWRIEEGLQDNPRAAE